MAVHSSRLVARGGTDVSLVDVHHLLAASFSVHEESHSRESVVPLDTFDARIRAAGMALEQRSHAGATELVLMGRHGEQLRQPIPRAVRLPALAEALPDGRISEVVARAVQMRALMSRTAQDRVVRRLVLRNEDDKTVVRVLVDEPTPASVEQALTVTVLGLRGYDDEAEHSISLLRSLGLVSGVGPTPEDEDRAADLDSSSPAAAMLCEQMAGHLATMRENLPGVVADIDTEFLHDFRVAVRRTRSTLKLGKRVFDEDVLRHWTKEFKWLGDLTTPVRDLDVYLLDLPVMAGWLAAAAPEDLDAFVAQVKERRKRHRRVLLNGLRSPRFRDLLEEWSEALRLQLGAAGPVDARSADSSALAGELAATEIHRLVRRVRKKGAAIGKKSPPAALHDLRKRCKELRYALDVFAPVLPAGDRRTSVKALKSLQDVLGRFQDSEVQRRALHGFAEELIAADAPAEAVLAMGELVAHLDGEQGRARREFAGAFARFDRSGNRRRLRRLGNVNRGASA